MNRKTYNQTRQRRVARTRAVIFGTAAKPRVSFFRSNKYNYAQAINDEKGVTIASVSPEAVKAKASRIEKAKAMGVLFAEQLKKAGVGQVVMDRGGYRYHGRVKAFAEGLREGGINV